MSTNHGSGPIARGTRTTDSKRRGGPTSRTKRSEDESGALLILALIFMTVISVICASLTVWATNDLNNTSKFASALSLQDASNSITQLALQDVRYNFTTPTLNASPPAPCWTPQSGPPVSQALFNFENVAVWCSTQWNPLLSDTRVVTFSTCPDAGNVPIPSGTPAATIAADAAACQAAPFLQAVVDFDDFPSTISASNCSPLGNSTCGTTFAVESWAFDAPVPSIATVGESANATCTSAKEIDITGVQLTGATTVNVILSSANNVVFTASVLSGGTDGSVSACAPSQMKSGTTYQVSVSTPSGTSATDSLVFS
jgi:hypothetical protein